MKSFIPAKSLPLAASALFLIACGNQTTQFSSASYAGAGYSLSGSATGKAKSIKWALENANVTSVPVESGMTSDEKLRADAEMKAILATLYPPVQNEPDAPASVPAVSTPAVSAPADSTPIVSTPAAGAPAVSTPAVSAPMVSTPADSAPADSAPAVSTPAPSAPMISTPSASAPTVSTPAASAPMVSTPAASAPTTEAQPIVAATQPKSDQASATSEAAAEAAKRAQEQQKADENSRNEIKYGEEEREDAKDFGDDDDFESSLPRIAVGDDAALFLEACAQSMKVDKKNLVIAGDSNGKLKKNQVLVVFASGGTLNVTPEVEKFRGLCVFASAAATVTVSASKTKINGLYIYERGNNNRVNLQLSKGGKYKSAVAVFSGSGNSLDIKGVSDRKCRKLKTYGSPGSVQCGKR